MLVNQQIKSFLFNLQFDVQLPEGFEVLHPFLNPDTQKASAAFFDKYYPDSSPRAFIIGINPGRFGAGITGVPFTDPIRLLHAC